MRKWQDTRSRNDLVAHRVTRRKDIIRLPDGMSISDTSDATINVAFFFFQEPESERSHTKRGLRCIIVYVQKMGAARFGTAGRRYER